MSQKDITEKILEDYNDVFADIMNVLLFGGENVIKPYELEEASNLSHYKAEDRKLHEQERDVAKFWERGRVKLALCGLENQTDIDKYMPLRVISYDGAAYRTQMLDKSIKEKYPVVTLILYFGEKRWDGPKSLVESLDIPEELKEHVSDYEIKVYEISYLSDEQLKMFKSDFGIVADFFVNKRKYENYKPKDKRKFLHVDAMLKFLSVMTKDRIYETVFDENEKEGVSMSSFWDRAISEGMEKGIEKGEEMAHRDTAITLLKEGADEALILKACKLTDEQLEEIKKEVFEEVCV